MKLAAPPVLIPMNGVIRRNWADALRSTEYSQGRGFLVRQAFDPAMTNGFSLLHCPLGVLCELAVKAGIIDPPRFMMESEFVYCGFYDMQSGLLPKSVAEWAGPISVIPRLYLPRKELKAAGLVPTAHLINRGVTINMLNDRTKLTFSELAYLIEAYPPGGITVALANPA